MHIFYYLIGAQARDIYLLDNGIEPSRGTMDIDFAVMVPEMDQYNLLISELEKHGFERTREPYRLIYRPSDVVVDLLPFGEIEQMATVRFSERNIEISVIGFKEVAENAVDYNIDNLTFKVSPLGGLCILKLLSWSQKNDRTKDLNDFGTILMNYFDINEDKFFEGCSENKYNLDDFSEEHFKMDAGARLLGEEIAKILNHSPELEKNIADILHKELENEPGKISRYLISNGFVKDFETMKKVFNQIVLSLPLNITKK